MKLVTSEQMRTLEKAAVDAGASLSELMEQAGLAVAQEVWLSLGVVSGRRVLVLVGPGNNGGDGLVAARHLADFDADVCVYMLRTRQQDANLQQVQQRDVAVFTADDDPGFERLQNALDGAEVVVDALLGIGTARSIDGLLAEILGRLRAATDSPRSPKVFAVDVPTGVDADTGRADELAVMADQTVTFGAAKVGLYMLPGSEHAGRIEVVDVGLPAEALKAMSLELLTTQWVRERLPQRAKAGNKGTFGNVVVVAGSAHDVGAARICAEGCYRAGAGLVRIATTEDVQESIAAALPEATWLVLADEAGAISDKAAPAVADAFDDRTVLLVGPGLGQSDGVTTLVQALLSATPSAGAVVDADALNALAATPTWIDSIRGSLVLTPHPGEMARLLGTTIEAVQADRLKIATEAATKWGQVVVLKGAHTIVAAPDGPAAISPYANPLLAVAGTGDVLAGVIAGLLAQGMAAFEAAACGVYVHGMAGAALSEELGDRGMLASELLPQLPRTMREIIQGRRHAAAAMPFPAFGDVGALGGLMGPNDAAP